MLWPAANLIAFAAIPQVRREKEKRKRREREGERKGIFSGFFSFFLPFHSSLASFFHFTTSTTGPPHPLLQRCGRRVVRLRLAEPRGDRGGKRGRPAASAAAV